MAGKGQPAQAARPNIIRAYGACAVCQCVLVRIMRDSGCSLNFSLHPESQSEKKNSALAMMKL